MTITPEQVWEAYRALHRYVKVTGKVARTDMPEKPYGRGVEATRCLAAKISKLSEEFPLAVTGGYYAYLYLFAQLIRVSLRNGPVYLGVHKGWRNLTFLPLHCLISRETLPPGTVLPPGVVRLSTPDETWWMRSHKQLAKKPDEIWEGFPWIENVTLTHPSYLWGPFMSIELWNDGKVDLHEFKKFVMDEEYWRVFAKRDVPQVLNAVQQAQLLESIDNVIRFQNDDALRQRWKTARKLLRWEVGRGGSYRLNQQKIRPTNCR